jgi:hypothetical protein
VRPSELVGFLSECYRERLAQVERHKAVAAHVPNYDVNNTYQYVINREETHLSWLADALAALDVPLPPPLPGPSLTIARGKDAWRALVQEDVRTAREFIDKWRPRVEEMTNARHRTMLRLMLGEAQEQARFFEQGAAGLEDLLGRGGEGAGKRGVVAGTRWIGD